MRRISNEPFGLHLENHVLFSASELLSAGTIQPWHHPLKDRMTADSTPQELYPIHLRFSFFSPSLHILTGTFEALAILSTMITQSQKECPDQIQSLCQGVSRFVLQCRAKAMKEHCVNIREKHPSSDFHEKHWPYPQAATQSHIQTHTSQMLKLFLPFPFLTSISYTHLHLLPSLLLLPH